MIFSIFFIFLIFNGYSTSPTPTTDLSTNTPTSTTELSTPTPTTDLSTPTSDLSTPTQTTDLSTPTTELNTSTSTTDTPTSTNTPTITNEQETVVPTENVTPTSTNQQQFTPLPTTMDKPTTTNSVQETMTPTSTSTSSTPTPSGGHLAIGFDIYRSGPSYIDKTLAIAVSVVDSELNEVDSALFTSYIPSAVKFNNDWYDQFYLGQDALLTQIEYTKSKNFTQAQIEMIQDFQQIRIKWQQFADVNGFTLDLVSPQMLFSGEYVNRLIMRYTKDALMPFDAGTGEYRPVFDGNSMIRGLILATDFGNTQSVGLSQRLSLLYQIPPSQYQRDDGIIQHTAYNAARDTMVLFGVNVQKYAKAEILS